MALNEAGIKLVDEVIDDLKDRFRTYLAQTSDHSLEFPIGEADLIYFTDFYGNKYIDFTSGIGVMNLGHSNPVIVNMVKDALKYFTHTMVYGEHMQAYTVNYAEALSKRFPEKNGVPQQVFFMNSGNEAVDLALKMARKIKRTKNMIAIKGGFHGRGLGAMSVSSKDEYKQGFYVDDRNTVWIDHSTSLDHFYRFNARPEVMRANLILELVQGEAGCIPLDPTWVQDLVEKVRRHGGLVIVDEIQTGYGRTGSFLAQEQYGIEADITCLGKAGGGGLPFGAVVSSRENFELLQTPPLSHLSTFGGNPVVCAGGLGVLTLMDDNLYEHVRVCGDLLEQGVTDLAQQFPDIIQGIQGVGLMRGLLLQSGAQTEKFYKMAKQRGLILHFKLNASNVLRMSPPLIISERSIKEAVDIMSAVCLDWEEEE